jgi:hypothetical protein
MDTEHRFPASVESFQGMALYTRGEYGARGHGDKQSRLTPAHICGYGWLMNSFSRIAAVLLLTMSASAFASAACVKRHPEGLSDETFVEAVVALRRAAADRTAYASARPRILAEHNVTEAQLHAYIQSHVDDLSHLASVWASINEKVSVPPAL